MGRARVVLFVVSNYIITNHMILAKGESPNPRVACTSSSSAMACAEELLLKRLRGELEGKGLEIHPFKLGWYNSIVDRPFCFSDDSADTLAVCVVNTPSMFEQLFLPYLRSQYHQGQLDPLDQCLSDFLKQVRRNLGESGVEIIQDFEMDGMRRPKVIMQSAGHVAGAAFYYQRGDVDPDPWDKRRKIYGVSMHPKYGGWFAFRAVLVFHGVLVPQLQRVEPVDCVPSRDGRVKLLEQFNFHWREWPGFRDSIEGEVVERYSKEQQEYFGTEPRLRFGLIEVLRCTLERNRD